MYKPYAQRIVTQQPDFFLAMATIKACPYHDDRYVGAIPCGCHQ